MSEEILNQKTGELVPVGELEEAKANTALVFGTQEPDGIIQKATAVANRLVNIVERAKLYSMIKDKKYVRAEGWTTMAAMLGVFPHVEYCRKLDREGEIAYEAKVVLSHLSGRVVGSGEAICSSSERTWSGRDEYAIKSMAQTRALGKACRVSFSWIMALAGYEVCPAEEMTYAEPGRSVSMPRSKKVPEAEEPVTHSDPMGAPSVPNSEPQRNTGPSKFFDQLHKVAREKGISPEKMKRAMEMLFKKESSKALTDDECVRLIKLIEKGALI